MMKKPAVPTILKQLLRRAGDSVYTALFRYMARTGVVLCAVEGEDGQQAHTEQDVQNGEDTTGTATENDQQGETEAKAANDEGATGTDDEEELVITLGEEPTQEDTEVQQAPAWVKELRKQSREQQKRIRELEAEKATREAAAAPGAIKVGEKPTLAGCDYDEERFEKELTAWHETKRQADDQAAAQRKQVEDAQAAHQARLNSYNTAKTALKVPDFEDAEAAVLETLDQTQQGIILHGAEKPEQMIYALGKNPAKLKELAAIKDPVKYAFAVARLENKLTVTPRKVTPAPERKVGGSAGGATSMDNTLARLEAEAERTGDRSKVIAYKRQQRQAA
jgi:hypothetical protein